MEKSSMNRLLLDAAMLFGMVAGMIKQVHAGHDVDFENFLH